MAKSFLEIAYEMISNSSEPVLFEDIWAKIVEEKSLSEEEVAAKIGRFYSNLTLDGRFVNLGDNRWDLKSRHSYDEVHIDMKDYYLNDALDDDNDSEEEVAKEEKSLLGDEANTQDENNEGDYQSDNTSEDGNDDF